jgi:hypothetical protein
MPLLYLDVVEGRDPGEIKAPLNTAHAALAEALAVPERDRYQVVNTQPSKHRTVELFLRQLPPAQAGGHRSAAAASGRAGDPDGGIDRGRQRNIVEER